MNGLDGNSSFPTCALDRTSLLLHMRKVAVDQDSRQQYQLCRRNPGRDISFPICIRKEIETRKLERKSKQKISRLIDLLYRLNDIISC